MKQLNVQPLSDVETFEIQNVQTNLWIGQYKMLCSRFGIVEHLRMAICSRRMLCYGSNNVVNSCIIVGNCM
jgi:hypothetical protein